MSKFSTADQLNAMTTLMSSLLQTLNQRGVLSDNEIQEIVSRAATTCGRKPEGAGGKAYLEEVYLQKIRPEGSPQH